MDASSLLLGLSRVAGMFDPASWAVGLAGECLGLDTKTRNLMRVIAGVVTLQPQTVLGGALGLLGEHLKEQSAHTEYHATGTANCAPPQGYAASPVRPPPPRPPPGQAQPQQLPCIPHHPPSPVRSILDDPSLSLEEKISRLVDAMLSKLDKDILDQGAKLDGAEGADREKVMRDLQRLMEQRRQMHDLASNTSAAFHGMCMTAIQNMRS
jgi:hypothetical protein